MHLTVISCLPIQLDAGRGNYWTFFISVTLAYGDVVLVSLAIQSRWELLCLCAAMATQLQQQLLTSAVNSNG